jgi:2-dehydro-3-deoxyphosphogluconate aldolase / (4S)-4-hydroxy-2-oxoglutarate aldolase
MTVSTTSELRDRLRALRVLPVIVIDAPDRAVPMARALADGGLPAAEITFRTSSAVESLRRIGAECPDVLLGAGTVLSPRQVDDARDAGARFIVAPGFNRAVVERAQEVGLPVIPGVCTPTEIEAALEMNLTMVKFFPAEAIGGLKFLRAIAAPYVSVEFVPTGGINADNVGAYLGFDRVVACGGSWMAPAERIAAGDFHWIRDQTARAVTAAGVKGIAGSAAAARDVSGLAATAKGMA